MHLSQNYHIFNSHATSQTAHASAIYHKIYPFSNKHSAVFLVLLCSVSPQVNPYIIITAVIMFRNLLPYYTKHICVPSYDSHAQVLSSLFTPSHPTFINCTIFLKGHSTLNQHKKEKRDFSNPPPEFNDFL